MRYDIRMYVRKTNTRSAQSQLQVSNSNFYRLCLGIRLKVSICVGVVWSMDWGMG